MATKITTTGSQFIDPIVITPAQIKREDVKKKRFKLDPTDSSASVSLDKGVYVFEFTLTNVPPITVAVSGTGTAVIDSVIGSLAAA